MLRLLFYHHLRHLYALRGDNDAEAACAKVEMQIGEGVSDPHGECWGAYGLANVLARSGRLAEATKQIERAMALVPGPSNIIITPTALQHYAFVRIQCGDYDDAWRALEQARGMIELNYAYVDYSIRTYPLLVESALGADWHDPSRPPEAARVHAAWRLSRRAWFWGKRFPHYLPHALRVRGRAAWCRGRHDQAQRCLRQAVQVAQTLGAQYDLARAHLDLAKIAGSTAESHQKQGRQILNRIGAVLPARES
jgi:tetratricopeptide (TPR) repeat protein